MKTRIGLAALVCAWALTCAAQLTPQERQLLQSGISAASATEQGKAADAAALARIIQVGDPELVRAFDRGLQMARIETLPPAIEDLLIASFADPRAGAALRALTPRYQTRRLFDLHYARLQTAFRSEEPSFAQILRTDQAGIEEPLLALASKYPAEAGGLSALGQFLARRRHPGAVPMLIAALEGSYQARNAARMQNSNLSWLLGYPSIAVWRQASEEIERLAREQRITPEAHAAARAQLAPMMNDPELALARMRWQQARESFERKRDALVPNATQLEALKRSSPRQYALEYAKHLAEQDRLAAESGDATVGYHVGIAHFHFGMFTRFRLRDPKAAVASFEKSARYRYALGQLALADTYQLELRDNAAAVRAYQAALDEARKPTEKQPFVPYTVSGSRTNQWWQAWLAQEIEFLRTGKPFAGRISEAAVGGFFDLLHGNATAFTETFAPDTQLGNIPASRLALFVTLRPMSELPKAQEILEFLARNDPSGYWSTCVMGTVMYLNGKGAAGRDEAQRNGMAYLLPGFAAAGSPNPLNAAAAQFMRAHNLRVKLEKP